MGENEQETLSCAFLPLYNAQYLLLPGVSLVEVIKTQGMNIVVDPQGGLIGKLQWRGWSVPLVSFDAASKETIPRFNMETKTAIVHSLSDDERLPYLGLTVQGAVKKVLVAENQIKPYSYDLQSPLIKAVVEINDQVAIIPDMQTLMRYISDKL